jgi:hypothetical protein
MITYGKYSIDPATLPAKNILAMLQRGVSHFLGNEVSARVGTELKSKAREALKTQGVEKPSDYAIAALVDAVSDEDYAAVKARLTEEAFQRLMTGEVGAAVRGPSVTPFDKAVQAEARARANARLKALGLKVPKGEETIKIGGKDKTFGDIVAGIIDRESEEDVVIKGVKWEAINKVAKRVVAESEKKAKAAKAMAESGEAPDGEDAGL